MPVIRSSATTSSKLAYGNQPNNRPRELSTKKQRHTTHNMACTIANDPTHRIPHQIHPKSFSLKREIICLYFRCNSTCPRLRAASVPQKEKGQGIILVSFLLAPFSFFLFVFMECVANVFGAMLRSGVWDVFSLRRVWFCSPTVQRIFMAWLLARTSASD